MTRKLTQALRQQKQHNVQKPLQLFGTLGLPLGGSRLVDVPNRPSFVYVQLRDNQNETIQAFNNRVASSYGLPVLIQREANRYVVLGVDTARYQNNWSNNAPYLPRHGTTHSFDPDTGGGGDMVWVFSKQFMPLLVYPSGTNNGPSVLISPHILLTPSNSFNYVGATGVSNLAIYLPVSGSIMALVYLDKVTGNPGLIINSGSNFSPLFTTAAQVTPYIPSLTSPATQIPLGAVRLVTGTNVLDWSYIYDVRQFVQAQSTGTTSSGGGGSSVDTIGFAGLYNGTPIGTGTFLNVRSPSGQAVFTKSGSMFDLFITGSNAAITPPVTGTVVVQNNGQTLGSVSTLNFRNNLFSYVSGTVAEVLLSGSSSTYMRVGQPTSLSTVTGQYWIVPDRVYATGSLSLFNQGHDLIPGIDYVEQHAISGTFQYISTPPTGTYNLTIYGVPATGGGGNTGSSSTGVGSVTPIDPSTISGYYLWNPDSESYANNDPVGTFTDQSPHGTNFTQSTGGNKPTFKTNILNGKSMLSFDGSDDYMTISLTLSLPYTIFIVYQCVDFSSPQRYLCGNNNWLLGIYSNLFTHYNGGFVSLAVGQTPNQPIVHSLIQTSTFASQCVNGQPAGGNAGTLTPGSLSLGDAFFGQHAKGYVGIVSIFPSQLTNIQHLGIIQWLKNYYAIM